MLISIVNHSTAISDAKLQAVIRAINRQLREDFEPHWGRGAQLRLEGRSARSPVPDAASDIRGNAVVYLCDCADEAETAIGYHELNQRGIPYGFVFTDLAKALKEPWSITLSHEVLELVLDPEVNLVAKGPHPEDPTREVFHWYEACDAVQTQWYEIDSVRVSNFVLPLYFTADSEPGGRNDFLGVRTSKVPPLASFGVAPGGYIGYFDPEVADDRYYEPSARARQRRVIKLRAGLARRGVRYQRNAAPLGQLDDLVGAEAPPPRLESIALKMKTRRATARSVGELARGILRTGWKVVPNDSLPGEFDLIPVRRSIDAGRAWELAYRLRDVPGVIRAEPLFEAQLPDDEGRQEWIAARLGTMLRASKQGLAQTAPKDPEWSAVLVRADRAWKLLDKKGIGYGTGVRVAHPDTGFTDHSELPQAQINQALDYDFVDDDDIAVDTLEEGLLLNPGHGTGTASVIVSLHKPQPAGALHVTGIAPAAELVPLRVSRSVIQKSQKNLRDAIHRAVDNGCHVISISLGGLWSDSLHDAVRRAVAEGVIVLAAAGNDVRFVVWPAHYDEVVAVAACNERGEPWSGSSRGNAVDVTGPGEGVYRAYWEKADNGDRSAVVGPSNGTSYAVATVAGIAALWLAYRASELAKYAKADIPVLFAHLVTSTCRKDLPVEDGFGSGIVDAEKLLSTPLPSSAKLRAAGERLAARAKAASDPLDRLAALFPRVERAAAHEGLRELLGRPPRADIAHLHEELRFWLTLDPKLHAAVAAHVGNGEADRARTNPRARRAHMLRARASITAIGASKDLRESLWSDR